MNILFVLENLTDKCGANVNIALTIAFQLQKENKIFALAKIDREKRIDKEKKNFFEKVYWFWSNEYGMLGEFYRKVNWLKKNNVQKIFLLLKNPLCILFLLDIKFCDSFFTKRRYKKEIERICKEQIIDVVMVFSAPHYLERVLKKAKIDAVKAVYQLDPYVYNGMLSKKQIALRKRIEEATLKKINVVFVTPLIYEEILIKKINVDKRKLVVCEFPGIKKIVKQETSSVKFDSNKVNLVFVGRLYPDIRNPRFLLELVKKLPSQYVLHIVGGGAEQILDEYKIILKSRLLCYGWLANNIAYDMIRQADILVNINNSVENQLASKLFDYICTGKPILNLCKKKNCPSLQYVSKYPYCMNIFEKKEIDRKLINDIIMFINFYQGKIYPFEKICEVFKNNTDEYVAELVIKNLKKKIETDSSL